MLQRDAVPDWGPETADVPDNLDLWRRALPAETMHTTTTGWAVADRTLLELYYIWLHTGALDMIAEVDSGLHSILQELMEERLEEEGIEL
jgi:heterodisulfide reductase subunit C